MCGVSGVVWVRVRVVVWVRVMVVVWVRVRDVVYVVVLHRVCMRRSCYIICVVHVKN